MTVRTNPGRRIVRRRRAGLAAVAAAGLFALTGCGSLHPGTAAVVGPATITHDEVDAVADALCSVNIAGAEAQGQPAPDLATKGAREAALQVLLDSELSRLFGESVGVRPNNQQVSQALAQNEAGIAMLPEPEKADFRQALKDYASGQLMLIEAGRQSLREQGQQDVTEDQALAEGQRLRSEYVKSIDVELDPRYGTFQDETLRPGGDTLSVATSRQARAANAPEPSAEWVSSLPASQKCS